jgi:protein SCO1/2
VLKRYGESFQSTTGREPFDHWQFTVVPAKELTDVANFFGLYFTSTDGQIVHSLSTTVISPDGTVYKWYEDNSWKPADLIADATAALQPPSEVRATAQTINAPPKDPGAVRAN